MLVIPSLPVPFETAAPNDTKAKSSSSSTNAPHSPRSDSEIEQPTQAEAVTPRDRPDAAGAAEAKNAQLKAAVQQMALTNLHLRIQLLSKENALLRARIQSERLSGHTDDAAMPQSSEEGACGADMARACLASDDDGFVPCFPPGHWALSNAGAMSDEPRTKSSRSERRSRRRRAARRAMMRASRTIRATGVYTPACGVSMGWETWTGQWPCLTPAEMGWDVDPWRTAAIQAAGYGNAGERHANDESVVDVGSSEDENDEEDDEGLCVYKFSL